MKAYALEINSTFFFPVFELVFSQIKFFFFGDGCSLGVDVGLGIVMEMHDLSFCSMNVFFNSSYLTIVRKLEARNFKFSGEIGQTTLNKSASKAH